MSVPAAGARRHMARWLPLAAGFVVLGTAAGLQWMPRSPDAARSAPPAEPAAVVPALMMGWQVSDEPLGPTENVATAAKETLGFDAYVHRRFSRGGISFTVFAAYWNRGKMPVRFVASHTPDRCWTASGLRCVAMKFRERYALEGRALLPAEYRAFTAPNRAGMLHVAYWHLVDGGAYDYGEHFNDVPRLWLWWQDAWREIRGGQPQQTFVRIAADVPFEQLWREADFRRLLADVARLGLWEQADAPAGGARPGH